MLPGPSLHNPWLGWPQIYFLALQMPHFFFFSSEYYSTVGDVIVYLTILY